MLVTACLLALLLSALVVLYRTRGPLGPWYRPGLGAILAMLLLGVAWAAREWVRRDEPPLEDLTALRPVSPETCAECHRSHHTSWQRTFHRTMTREATPENVKADFDGTPQHHLGVMSRMIREGDRYYMDTVDPEWAGRVARQGIALAEAGPAPRRKLSVDRLVGSHWFQQMLHRDENGTYLRLPLAYHIVERRWIHIDGAFLGPDSGHFFSKVNIWNETCVFCHNTRPIKNPQHLPNGVPGYRTEVAELGIACEACHGSGERHVRAHRNAARRSVARDSDDSDPTIVNPAKLSAERSVDICARCHAVPMPRRETWDRQTQADPFLAGGDLRQFWHLSWSEAEMRLQEQGRDAVVPRPKRPEPLDGRFWGDGTPLTTSLEYQGMALSACYKKGHGELTCLSCHSMHGGDPNHQLKSAMRTNEACYACHETYRKGLAGHTHHAADSSGSLCHNCHMPHQVYSLLTTHRSHRIAIPRVRDSLGTGKPHACNLCHLDKSLGWTGEQLRKWYGTKPEPLSDDERTVASSVLHLAQSDARTRAVVAGAFAWSPAQQASGRDWPALLLTRTLDRERYQAVRYTTHRALRSLYGPAADAYDYQGTPARRAAQVRELRLKLGSATVPNPSRYPHLPLTETGHFADDVFDRLSKTGSDPKVAINE